MPNNTNQNCHDIITSEDYIDLLFDIIDDVEEVANEVGAECIQYLEFDNWVFHIKTPPEGCIEFYKDQPFLFVPSIYGLTSTSSMNAAGISPVLESNLLNVSGEGVIIAILDTGIDYTHEAFINEDNTSKILSIWDQTQKGEPPDGFQYGAEYTNEQINEAIDSDNPLSIVPTVDDVGHGTFLAGIAAGRPNAEWDFTGAAPDADLIVVKLKQAKKCLMEFYQFKEDAVGFQENDVMQGINYIIKKVQQFRKPVVILFTGASSDGPHNGDSLIGRQLGFYGEYYGIVGVLAAGNEGNAHSHYHGFFREGQKSINVELNIASGERGVFINMWGYLPDLFTVEVISPDGTSTGIFPFTSVVWQEKQIGIGESSVSVYYDISDKRDIGPRIGIILKNPSPGLWTIKVYGDIVEDGNFDIWLPVRGFKDNNTVFFRPNPDTTIVSPANNIEVITVGAINENTGGIYLLSSRGFKRGAGIKPDIVAPGFNVIGPYPNNIYGTLSGTSVSAAITAGASALLLQWGIVKGNYTTLNTITVKTFLIRGANRLTGFTYPNKEFGYGELDLFNTIGIIQSL